MQTECEQLKKSILRRVNRIYFWRTYTRPVVIESFILGGLVTSTFFMVSISSIVANAYSIKSTIGFSRFILTMFENTEFSMKVFSLAGVVLTILVMRDMFGGVTIVFRKIRSSFS